MHDKLRNQSAMRNWYNCWYIYVTKEPQSHHTRSVSFSIEFIRFALHSHFPRTCRRRSHCRHWRRLFIAQRGRQPNSTHLISFPFYRPKNPISIFHNLHPIALGRTCVFNTKHPREGCDASRRRRCRRRVRLGPIRRMMYRCFPYLALDSRWERAAPETARDSNLHRPFSDPENTWRLTADYTTVPCFTACQKSVYSGYRRGQLPPPRSCRRPIMEQLWSHRVTRGGTIRIINGCFSLSLGVCVCVFKNYRGILAQRVIFSARDR